MSNQALEQLALTLKTSTSELNGLSTLNEHQISQLTVFIENSQKKQRQTLNDAIETGLSHVPALLRGAVKAIVRG